MHPLVIITSETKQKKRLSNPNQSLLFRSLSNLPRSLSPSRSLAKIKIWAGIRIPKTQPLPPVSIRIFGAIETVARFLKRDLALLKRVCRLFRFFLLPIDGDCAFVIELCPNPNSRFFLLVSNSSSLLFVFAFYVDCFAI